MAAYKGTVELGGLYQDGRAIPRPDQPWLIDTSVLQPYDGLMPGNIADFSGNPDWSAWVLGDTPTQELARLRWHVFEDEGRTLLICDRVILVKVSWNDLNQVGFVNGAAVQIDVRRWNCRLLTGGSQPRQGSDGHSRGAPEGNEWDHYVVNEAGIKGLPMPALSDTDQILSVVDKASAHNQFWNWMGVNTWVREHHAIRDTARCCRGYAAAAFFYTNTFDHRHEDIGWRPVLEQSSTGSGFMQGQKMRKDSL